MQTEIGIDTGDMLDKEVVDIDENDTYGTLSEKLSVVGANLIVKVLDNLEKGICTFTKQDDEKASHTKMIKKEDTLLCVFFFW